MNLFLSCAVFAVAAVNGAVPAGGVVYNPEDQWRHMSIESDGHLEQIAAAGFNLVRNMGLETTWSFTDERPKENCREIAARVRKTAEKAAACGLNHIPYFRYAHAPDAKELYPVVNRDGSINPKRRINASNPDYQRQLRKAISNDVAWIKQLPGICGVQLASEMRDHAGPPFSPALTNAYKAYSGRSIPSSVLGRNPVPWQKLKNFPADRVVQDRWSVLEFYRWLWREGDGWRDALEIIADEVQRGIGEGCFTMFNPVLRTPSMTGLFGHGIQSYGDWVYTTPEPYRILYPISELQAVIRDRPDKQIQVGLQAIMYRSGSAPLKKRIKNAPAWAKEFPNTKYITTAPDILQQALWHIFSRKVDGISIHHETTLFDMTPHDRAGGYQCTNPESIKRISKIFNEVGVPLGPLFRAVPERAPEVAVLESASGQILGGRLGWAPHRNFSDVMFITSAANISPYVIYEDEVGGSGIPESVKVLIMPRCDVLVRSAFKKVSEFRKRGGRILADDMLLPALKADAEFVTLEDEEKNMHGDYDNGRRGHAIDSELRQASVRSAARKLREAVGLELYADSDKEDILVHVRTYGRADYVFAVNDRRTAGDYIGPWRMVLEKGLPNEGTVKVRRTAGAVYDLVRHTAVPFTVRDGMTEIPVRYDTNDGRVFMVTDRPLCKLTYELKDTTLVIRSHDREAMIPVRIDGFGKKPWYAVVKGGEWRRDFGTAPKGLAVMNLADGKHATVYRDTPKCGLGPVNNPEDQWRKISLDGDTHFPEIAEAGFNSVSGGPDRTWDFTKDGTRRHYARIEDRYRRLVSKASACGLGARPYFRYAHAAGAKKLYPRRKTDGSVDAKPRIDATHPAYLEGLEKAVRRDAAWFAELSGVCEVALASEMRDHTGPPFSPALTNAYRAFSGRDIPSAVVDRNPVPWRERKDFPADRVVPDDEPVLDFYRWLWRKGDGWSHALDVISSGFTKTFGRNCLKSFDPVLRTPSMRDCFGSGVNGFGDWVYATPEPYRILYPISELQATVRNRPDAMIDIGLQAIMYRSGSAPLKKRIKNAPAWAKEFPNTKYITTAPDILQQALWHIFSRKVDGLDIHHETSLFDMTPHDSPKGYQCTNPESLRRLSKVLNEVGVPLGPLFRAVPERAPVVAVLESYSSQILGAHISWAPHRYFADIMFITGAANIPPYVLYEDEVAASGIPSSVKVLIMPRCDVLTRSAYERVAEFKRRGGRIVADDMLLPALKADAEFVTLEDEEKNMHGDYDNGRRGHAIDSELRQASVRSAARKLKEAVGLELYADSDKEDILVHVRTCGSADYVFAVNDRRTAGDYIGPWRMVLEKGLPNEGTVKVRRTAGAVYDLVRHTAVPFTVRDGMTEIPVRYDTNDGRVFMMTDRPLAVLTYELEGTLLTVRSSDRDVMIPVRIDGFGKKPWYAVVKGGEWRRDFGVRPEGLAVMNLADGKQAVERTDSAVPVREAPLAFRKRLETVHKPGLRDLALRPAEDEYVFRDGVKVGDVDFADYLRVSMGVEASAASGDAVKTVIDPALRAREYEITVGEGGVSIRAHDDRALRQARYHLEDLMNLRRAPFLKFGTERRRALFSPRMVHSGWGLDIFPDAHLVQMAHYGIDAILIFLKDIDRTQGGGENAGVNDIIDRALAHGIDTYLYSKIQGFAHPDDPAGAAVLRKSFGRVAQAHPKAKGIVFVGESCQFPSRDPRVQPVHHREKNHDDPRPLAGWFPCRDYPDWLRAVQNALYEHAPGMEIVFWTYNWSRQPAELCADLVGRFPDNVAILSTFGKGGDTVHRNGMRNVCRDYTISTPGPTGHFTAESKAAGENGRRLYAMSNTGGLTWDFGTIPYQPCPYQWKRRWDALRRSNAQNGLSGLMESHHFGWYPSFVSELAKEAFTEGGIPFDEHIRKIAARDFGESNVDKVLSVWKRWSDAADDYVATNENQYGPFRIGPAYPFNFGGKPIEYKDFPQDPKGTFRMRWMTYLNYPYDLKAAQLLNIVYNALPDAAREQEMELLRSAHKAYVEGADVLRGISATLDPCRRREAERLAGIGEYMGRTVRTAVNLRLGYDALTKGDKERLMAVARDEYANASATIPLVAADSRLGWEPSMEYAGTVEQIRWKLGLMESVYGPEVKIPDAAGER